MDALNKFEVVKTAFTPVEWWKNDIGIVTSCGRGNTYYPYNFTRALSDTLLLLYTTSGKGFLEYKGRNYTLGVGDVFIIDCYEFQRYGAFDKNWDFIFVHLNKKEIIMPYYEAITNGGTSALFHYPAFKKECWDRVDEFIKNNDVDSMYKSSVSVINFMLNLLLINKTNIPENFSKIAGYMREHYNENISVDALAEAAHLSKYHFIRRFKKYYGSTPHEYMVLCRIDNAKNLLINTETTIEEIAEICGFSSLSAFSLCFKNSVGINPTEFRKQFKLV